ncbi:3',5'-cyclic adenosine monophosphate phosphodiesterase CpdA [Acaryochloris thomasi RCC1774]|uniref:3',5'-cyclic adenosine monophosphate phosphodiesterase CpdA n=2 Tax=Acaryochloris TaxID=155977 RepID=A0A2W1JFV7_9CYAN|nr:3',5'-cyclic adenosine monophosphate phosphodiesterase CpdA [Acaryochloris thomasi RCC1774]
MPLNRRKFLLLGGTTIGLATSAAVRGLDRKSASQANHNLSSAPQTSPSPAPQGVFAPQRGDVRLIVISDMNSQYGSTTYRAEVEAAVKMLPDWQPDLVICAGDMVAGQSLKLSQQQVQSMWDAFGQKILQPIRKTGLPFALTLGNHDASSYRNPNGKYVYALDREVANSYWSHQEPGLQYVDRADFPFYYSFQQNEIFYLVWDASSANISDEERVWAERSLASDVAQQAKMRIVIGHLPFYAVAQGRDRAGEILNRADELRLLLERHNVHTYICGHHHVYFPGRAGELEMLHTGALGSGPRSWLGSNTAPIQTLTVVDITLDTQTTSYTTYDMGSLEIVKTEQIPRLLVGPNGRELRRDLTLADLTPEESNQQHVLSK